MVPEPLEVGQDPGVETTVGQPSRSIGGGDGRVEAPAERQAGDRGRRAG